MYQPEGFEEPGTEVLVCLLLTEICGLKQGDSSWYKTLHSVLISMGFIQSGKINLHVFILIVKRPKTWKRWKNHRNFF